MCAPGGAGDKYGRHSSISSSISWAQSGNRNNMRPVSVFMDGFDKLCVRAAFEQKDACKSIPGAKWNTTLKVWWYPPTPMAARTIAETFQHAATWDADAKRLLQEADDILAAAKHKTAE